MNKTVIAAYGSPFSHVESSCLGWAPRNHLWVYDPQSNHEIGVFMDNDPLGGMSNDRIINKYLWLSESKSISPVPYRLVEREFSSLLRCYRLIFTCDRSLVALDPRIVYVPNGSNMPWVKRTQIPKKTKHISLISSGKALTDGHRTRNKIIQTLLSNFPFIDTFGTAFRQIKCKEEALRDYRYSIVIENAVYSDYYTEKVMDCFAMGTIPIYLGCPTIGNFYNAEGIIPLDFSRIGQLDEVTYERLFTRVQENYHRCWNTKMSDDLIFDEIMRDLSRGARKL